MKMLRMTEEEYAKRNKDAVRLKAIILKPKYSNIKTNGYSSKKEAKRAEELKQLERAGAITGLREQVVYILAPSVVVQGRKRPPIRYIADFVYEEMDLDEQCFFIVVEDCKGFRTPIYNLKRHLMKSVHGIEIRET